MWCVVKTTTAIANRYEVDARKLKTIQLKGVNARFIASERINAVLRRDTGWVEVLEMWRHIDRSVGLLFFWIKIRRWVADGDVRKPQDISLIVCLLSLVLAMATQKSRYHIAMTQNERMWPATRSHAVVIISPLPRLEGEHFARPGLWCISKHNSAFNLQSMRIPKCWHVYINNWMQVDV